MSGPSTTKGTAEAVRDRVFTKPLNSGSNGRAETVFPARLIAGTPSVCPGSESRGCLAWADSPTDHQFSQLFRLRGSLQARRPTTGAQEHAVVGRNPSEFVAVAEVDAVCLFDRGDLRRDRSRRKKAALRCGVKLGMGLSKQSLNEAECPAPRRGARENELVSALDPREKPA
jgi:hypothetical protein